MLTAQLARAPTNTLAFRKQQLSSQTTELEALEARIREMEQRLQQRKSTHYSPDSSLNQRLADAHAEHKTQTAALQTAGHQRSPVAGVFSQHQDVSDVPPPLPEKDQGRERTGKLGGNSRPGTARQSQQAVPGALPPTPTSSEPEGEYRTKIQGVLSAKPLLTSDRLLNQPS